MQAQERVFLNLLQARRPVPEKIPTPPPSIVPEPAVRHESVKKGDMESAVWGLRRRGHAPREDAKPGVGQKKVDHYNLDHGMQKDTSTWKKGDPDYPLM